MHFNKTIETYRKQIETALEQFFQQLIKENKNPHNSTFLETMREFTLRKGKRLRPLLVIIAFNAFKKQQTKQEQQQILQIALTTELLESFFLMHDDIIDKSALRRGKLTVHKQFEQLYNKQLAQNLALLTGDALLSFAFLPIINSNFAAEIKVQLIEKINTIMQHTNFGQLHELLLLQKEINQITEEQILQICREKTARYTLEGPLQLGAIAAGANQNQLQKISKIALPLGVAFQLQDDILGLFGTVEKIGKPIDSDVKEGKKTLLMYKALKKASFKQRKYLLIMLGNQKVTVADIQQIRQIVVDTESLIYSQQLIHKLLVEAKREVESLPMFGESKRFLLQLADYIGARES